MTRSFTIETCTSADPIQVDADEIEIGDNFLIFRTDEEAVFLIAAHAVQTVRGTDSRPAAAA
jgi:hypothetical protein